MKVAALLLWILTAVGGLTMLAEWVRHGGIRQRSIGGTRFPIRLIFGHAALAASGLILWIAFIATGNRALGWVAFAILIPVAALGVSMFVKWLGGRGAHAGVGENPPPPEQHFPVLVVALHALAATATLIVVLLAAAGV